MRVAVVTDIHGNRHALFAMLADLRRVGVDEVVFGGDAALFGSRPRECWERVLDLRWRCVQGNTDRYIVNLPSKLAALGDAEGAQARFLRTNVAWAAERLGPASYEDWEQWRGRSASSHQPARCWWCTGRRR